MSQLLASFLFATTAGLSLQIRLSHALTWPVSSDRILVSQFISPPFLNCTLPQ